jgi:hypothetical protein
MHEMRAILGMLCLLSFPLAPGAVAQPQEPAPQSTDARQSAPPTLLALPGVIFSTESLLGSEVQCDGHPLTLRDAQGMPRWHSVRRRPSP